MIPPNILGQGKYIQDFKETRFDQKKSSFPPTHPSKKKSLYIVLIIFKNKICIILQFKHSNVHVIYLIRQREQNKKSSASLGQKIVSTKHVETDAKVLRLTFYFIA